MLSELIDRSKEFFLFLPIHLHSMLYDGLPMPILDMKYALFLAGEALIFLNKLVAVVSVELIVLQRDLLIVLVGVHIGAPYNRMGLKSESNSVRSALKNSFERMTTLFRPKNARIALVLRFC